MTKNEVICEYDYSYLFQYLQENIEDKEKNEENVTQLCSYSDHYLHTLLHLALKLEKSVEIVSKLINIGGRELIMKKNQDGQTALHFACQNENTPLDIVSKLVDEGGHEMTKEIDQYGKTALHYAMTWKNKKIIKLLRKHKMRPKRGATEFDEKTKPNSKRFKRNRLKIESSRGVQVCEGWGSLIKKIKRKSRKKSDPCTFGCS